MLAFALVGNINLALTRFHGEDEPEQARAVSQIAHELLHLGGVPSLARIGEVLISADNPPLRYVSLPGWLVAETAWVSVPKRSSSRSRWSRSWRSSAPTSAVAPAAAFFAA